MRDAFLAIDWGTTNARAWVVDQDGGIVRHREFALGVGSLQPGEAEQRFHDTVRPALAAEALPAILCGMIGSTLGWKVVPYLDCPADLAGVQAALCRVDAAGPPVWIVPGLRAERPDGGPDVMRGEETQVIGWMAADQSRSRGEHLLCLPGTHAKWVRLVDGRVETFVTAMTGELFAVLRKHSVLRPTVEEAEEDAAAFAQGIAAAGDGSALTSRLFTARSRVVGGDMKPEAVASYLSGLLIGAEVASVPALLGQDVATVSIVGDPTLSDRYRAALAARGVEASVVDGEDAALAGLAALFAGVRG